jgi:hypothetical protein
VYFKEDFGARGCGDLAFLAKNAVSRWIKQGLKVSF